MEDELRKLIKSAIILDIVAYLISTLYLGFTLEFFYGLLLGTAAYITTLLSLRDSILRMSVRGTKKARQIMAAGYSLRVLISSAAVYLGLTLPFLNVVAVILPLFYTKITMYSKSLFSHFFKK